MTTTKQHGLMALLAGVLLGFGACVMEPELESSPDWNVYDGADDGRLVEAATVDPVYDDSAGWTYVGTWSAASSSGAWNQTLHWTNVDGSEAQFTCTAGGSGAYGVAFDLVHTRAYNRGIAKIWVTHPSQPNQPLGVQYFDLYGSGVERQQRITYSTGALVLGTGSPYVVHVQATGDQNAQSSDDFIDIDAIECDLD